MITKFLTSITTTFSPFALPSGRTARHFLAQLPPNARSTMKISVKMLPREAATATAATASAVAGQQQQQQQQQRQKASLQITFKDGRTLDLDLDKVGIKEVQEEVNRHSRVLGRQEELSSG
ncbi:hypothetical protein LTS18_009888 [Coniosporium uncinatum]|uniref:Uncharacterized protein n=1 Tax=Coniosporium uncinatum TaxID=93489 RepID=A0ACC3DM38_9PEZI|nr:hypothetical protein LTS18_009888 [Coniosporium uncinatum]